MSRGYRHIQEYEKEILNLRAQGKTGREIQENLDLAKNNTRILSQNSSRNSNQEKRQTCER